LGALLLASACITSRPLVMPELALVQRAEDFHTYPLRRVGIMPFSGAALDADAALELQEALFQEIAVLAPYELVKLDARDLAEVEESEPFRRGYYRAGTIIAVSRRYDLDAIVFGSVAQQRFYPPQSLSMQVDMVAAETGLVVWSAAVHLDASDPRVREGIERFFGGLEQSDETTVRARDVALLSPERFARFAAYQVASTL
jgi:hypothetical protein